MQQESVMTKNKQFRTLNCGEKHTIPQKLVFMGDSHHLWMARCITFIILPLLIVAYCRGALPPSETCVCKCI
jgi:hypothetical protein